MLGNEVVYHTLGDDDAAPVGIARRYPTIGAEECDADQQEVQHRLAEKLSQAHALYLSTRIRMMRAWPAHFGEYQMGDVNARSCVVIGTFGSVILILK